MKDVVPPHKSIRNIPVPPGRKRSSFEERVRSSEPSESASYAPYAPAPRRRSRVLWVLAGIVLCSLAGLLVAALFEGATVTVVPKTAPLSLSLALTASVDAPAGALSYETISFERSATRTLAAGSTVSVERRASGKAIIYNAYSAEPQRLIKNTRFEAPDGTIYRINESVVVPGTTTLPDKSVKPGETTVTLYADSPGESYNKSGVVRFTIPGFKGDPRYGKFSAQSIEPITGGFVGQEKVISEETLTAAKADMDTELSAKLSEALASEVPSGYLFIENSLILSYADTPREDAGEGRALVGRKGVGVAAVVREKDLATAIARSENIPGYAGEALLFQDSSSFTVAAKEKPKKLGEAPLPLLISGDATLLWQFDREALAEELAGKHRRAFEGIISSKKPAIISAEASLQPFFKTTFPEDPSDIEIRVHEDS